MVRSSYVPIAGAMNRPYDTGRSGIPDSVDVIIVFVIIERDAVLLRQGGVLVVFRFRTMIVAANAQIDGAGTSLLQLSRFFEAAMTTLLHGRAPNLEK
jgi:hypothetical protein